MARYTIELRDIENCICYLFPKGFPFYSESEELRLNFIQKFYDEYMFREIGFETVERFKRSLLGKLNKIIPYYKQLYHTELESKDINFMLNKDLIETFEREVNGTSEINSNATSNATTELINNVTNNVTNNTTETSSSNSNGMLYDTPISKIDDITKYPTQGSQEENSTTSTSNTSSIDNSEGNSNTSSNATSSNKQIGENTQSEKTSLISKGNIGVTSSAQLLKEWREVIINIDEMILNDLEDLFMLLY